MVHRARSAIIAGVLLLVALFAVHRAPDTQAASTLVRCDAGDDLQGALDEAAEGAVLRIQGTCTGNFVVSRGVRLRGLRDATLVGDGGTVVTIAEDAEVVITDLVITGGKPNVSLLEEESAGGIYNAGSLTLTGHASVYANTGYHCGPNPPRGPCTPGYSLPVPRIGGIVNIGVLVMRDRATVRENYSGILNLGTLTMRNRSSVETNTNWGSGAGISNEGLVTLRDRASVRGNHSGGRGGTGGGISNLGDVVLNDRAAIEDNESSQFGGGVVNVGTLTLNDRAAIRNNRGYVGAGVMNAGSIALNDHYSITENVARFRGAGLFIESPADVTGSLSGVTGNTPDQCYSSELDGPCSP